MNRAKGTADKMYVSPCQFYDGGRAIWREDESIGRVRGDVDAIG